PLPRSATRTSRGERGSEDLLGRRPWIVALHVARGAAAGAASGSRVAALLLGPVLHRAGDRLPHEDLRSRQFEIGSGVAVLLLAVSRHTCNSYWPSGSSARSSLHGTSRLRAPNSIDVQLVRTTS